MPHRSQGADRRGARRKGDVAPSLLVQFAKGDLETVNLMEWLAADMSELARSVAREFRSHPLSAALLEASEEMRGQSITRRLAIAGHKIADTISDLEGADFLRLASHRSDLVRQWACYALNDRRVECDMPARLRATLRFAADKSMSVRETAWMAFRPHIISHIDEAIRLLEPCARHPDGNIRRFAIEVTRPRSVWGVHIRSLKDEPGIAAPLLERVRREPARYVQLSIGNWLNDASKSRPYWVIELCSDWLCSGDENTRKIVKRGLRTLNRTATHFQTRGGIRSRSRERPRGEEEPMLKASVSGSFHRHMSGIYGVVQELRALGVDVLSPSDPRVVDHLGEFLFVASDRLRSVKLVQDRHFEAIRSCDFLWVVCPDGYTGPSTSAEIGAAHVLGVPIFSERLPLDVTLQHYVTKAPSVRAAVQQASERASARYRSEHHFLIDPDHSIDKSIRALEDIRVVLTRRRMPETCDADEAVQRSMRVLAESVGLNGGR